MKRVALLTALLLAAVLSAVCVLPWGEPTGELAAGPAETADGAVLAAENRRFTSRIYTLREGRVDEVYEEPRLRGGEERRIARVAVADGEVCFLRLLGDGGEWELARLENGTAQSLHREAFEDEITVTGLQGRDGVFWITGIGANRAIFVYEYIAAEERTSLKMILPLWWLRDAAAAEYDGTLIRAATVYGDACFITPEGRITYSPDAAERPAPDISVEGFGRLLCKRTLLRWAALAWLAAEAVVLAAYVVCRRALRLATRLTAVGSVVLLFSLLAAEAAAFCTVSGAGGLTAARQTAVTTGGALAAVWLAGTLLLRMAAGRITAPVLALTRQMDRIADGDSAAREAADGRDELCQMDRSLQMMCMNLSVRDYETAATIRSYRRFVPERMAELLDRPVVEEIRLGDSRRMTGNVCVFSVGNRTEARNSLEDAAFLEFINHSFGVFHDCISENRGWMVSGGLRLSAMEALFPNSPADGVHAGLDFLGKLRVQEEEGAPEPRACLILHKASFLYGIAGQEECLFPYLSSSELDFLGGFAQKFDAAGVRIVATEAYWKQLEGCGFTARYIGFVSAGERGGAYKLYELLDAYSELERDLRKSYDNRFQEAVNLFYRNDFYLARNLFSTLLRVCPGDGIARWYLFACERLFNQEGGAETDYSLFGLET